MKIRNFLKFLLINKRILNNRINLILEQKIICGNHFKFIDFRFFNHFKSFKASSRECFQGHLTEKKFRFFFKEDCEKN